MRTTGSCVILVAVAFFLGCSDNSVVSRFDDGGPRPKSKVVIEDLTDLDRIGYGQTVHVESEDLDFEFLDILESRCPIGVFCIWEGEAVAEFELSKPGEEAAVAAPVIRPGRDPDRYTYLKAYTLDYRITLLELHPYPHVRYPFFKKDYIAVVRVEKIADPSGFNHVTFTDTDPTSLGEDMVTLTGAAISGNVLTIDVRYGGGCGEHSFTLYMRPYFLESYPVQADLFLKHVDHDDPCDAIVSGQVSFDVMRIGELYKGYYGRYDDIILNIYDCLKDDPGEEFSVLYSP